MRDFGVIVTALSLAACSASDTEKASGERAVPVSRSPAATTLGIPRLALARVASASAGAAIATLRVQVVIEGTLPADSAFDARAVDPVCEPKLVDTKIEINGNAVVGALLWVEGTGTVIDVQNVAEHRPTVVLEQCRLLPRVQLAAPGSTIQLVNHDERVESLVIVPIVQNMPADTIAFNTGGQLVPVRNRADSSGVLGIYSTRLPWARAFVAIAPSGVAAITDASGTASFMLDRAATMMVIRAWHPALGLATGSFNPSTAGAAPTLTLTYRR